MSFLVYPETMDHSGSQAPGEAEGNQDQDYIFNLNKYK